MMPLIIDCVNRKPKVMKIKNRYIVMALEYTVEAEYIPGIKTEVKLSWADRMCGALAVFETKKAAQKYAGKKYKIIDAKAEIK